MLFAKLRATFDSDIWESVLQSAGNDFDREEKSLEQKLANVEQKMVTLLDNFSYVQSKSLAEALEKQCEEQEQAKKQLESQLKNLSQRAKQQETLIELAQKADNVLRDWAKMSLIEKQAVARVFIERIIVTPTDKYRVADLEIHWRDGSKDELVLPYSAKNWSLWLPEEVATLAQLLEDKASQVEISAALPNRNWRAIRIKAYEALDTRSFKISPKPIRETEKYADYFARMEETGWEQPRKTGSRWTEEEITKLEKMLNGHATQLELCAALPHRSWAKIRRKIT